MDNKLILKISLSIAMIGIIGLYVFTSSSQNMVNVYETSDYLGQRVTVEGSVSKYYVSKDGHVFFDLHDSTGVIKVVAFRNSNIEESYNLKEGENIVLTGKVQEYKNNLEIIASRIDF